MSSATIEERGTRNRIDRERLRALTARLRPEDWRRPLAGGWTPAALLAHHAFWDRFVLSRWEQFARDGVLLALPDEVLELTNEAALPLWLALSGDQAPTLALAAAEQVDLAIEALPPRAVDLAIATGRPWLTARFIAAISWTRLNVSCPRRRGTGSPVQA